MRSEELLLEEEEFVVFNDIPITTTQKPRTKIRQSEDMQSTELAMWDHFEAADFTLEAGEDPDYIAQLHYQALAHQADTYGAWNGAEALPGYTDLDDVSRFLDDDDEEDLLSEIMRNIG
jgi:hypothetical protein